MAATLRFALSRHTARQPIRLLAGWQAGNGPGVEVGMEAGPSQSDGRRLVPRRCAFWRVTASCRSGPFRARGYCNAGRGLVGRAEGRGRAHEVRPFCGAALGQRLVRGTPNPHAVSGFRVREGQSVAKRGVERHHFAPRSPKRTQKASNSISLRPFRCLKCFENHSLRPRRRPYPLFYCHAPDRRCLLRHNLTSRRTRGWHVAHMWHICGTEHHRALPG